MEKNGSRLCSERFFKMSAFLSFLIILHYEIPAFFGFEVK